MRFFLLGLCVPCFLGDTEFSSHHVLDTGINLLQLTAKKLKFGEGPVVALVPEPVPLTFGLSTHDRFEFVKEHFMRRYGVEGRQDKKLPRSAVSLDYELQPLCELVLTPDVLLERGHMDLAQSQGDSLVLVQTPRSLPLFPKVSEYFEVGLDGKGIHHPHRQQLGAVMEFGTVVMRPREVLNTTLFEDMQDYIAVLRGVNPGDPIPGGAAQIQRCQTFKTAEFHPEFSCNDKDNCCTDCDLQFTVGIDVARVDGLFELSDAKRATWARTAVSGICSREGVHCSPEYRGLLILATWTLKQVHESRVLNDCNNPKLAMKPWLVRTHFGDLFRAVERMHGTVHLKDFQEHVLEAVNLCMLGEYCPTQATNMTRQTVVLPHGLIDYLNFPEMAELGGYVASRNPSFSEHLKADYNALLQPMPVSEVGLQQLAQQMIDGREAVDAALAVIPCGLWGSDNDANSFTAGEWLDGVSEGYDIMSDADSPISQKSFSGLVWKSMGSWRMDYKQDSRVYLECRSVHDCLQSLVPPFESPGQLARLVAETIAEFEGDAVLSA